MVFDDDDRVAFVGEAVEDVDEAFHVLEVESDGGLLDEVEVAGFELGVVEGGLHATAFDELGDELDALSFTAGERGGGLAELEVAEAGIGHEFQGVGDARLGLEEGGGFGYGHGQHLADIFFPEGDLQGSWVVAHAVAFLTVDPGGGEEIHFEFHPAVAFAIGAPPTLGIEGETGGFEAAHACLGELSEEGADVVEDFNVGGGAGAGGFADGGLIDFVNGFDVGRSGGGFVAFYCFGFLFSANHRGGCDGLVEDGGFSGTGNAGEDGEAGEGDGYVDVFEVVGVAVFDFEVWVGFWDVAA